MQNNDSSNNNFSVDFTDLILIKRENNRLKTKKEASLLGLNSKIEETKNEKNIINRNLTSLSLEKEKILLDIKNIEKFGEYLERKVNSYWQREEKNFEENEKFENEIRDIIMHKS